MKRLLVILSLFLSTPAFAITLYPNRTLDSTDTALSNKWPTSSYAVSTYAAQKAADERNVGTIAANLTIKYWIDSASATRDLAQSWVDAIVADTDIDIRRFDLAVSSSLLAVSLFYDWAGSEMTGAEQTKLKNWIHYVGAGQYYGSAVWDNFWAHQPWQNHNVINHTANLAAGLAISADFSGDTTVQCMKISGVPTGHFVAGETATGGTSSATCVVAIDNYATSNGVAQTMICASTIGTFQALETLTGGTSGATMVVSTTNTACGNPTLWISNAKTKLVKARDLQNEVTDGSFHEGHGYGGYDLVWFVRGLELMKQSDPGTYSTVFTSQPLFQNFYKFFEAHKVDQTQVQSYDLEDSVRYEWYNPAEYMIRFFQLYGTQEYLNIARYYETSYTHAIPELFDAIYTDGTEGSATANPILGSTPYDFFNNMGVYKENSLSGSNVNVGFMFRAGIPGGWDAINHLQLLDVEPVTSLGVQAVNVSHSHPDPGHIIIWSATAQGFLLEDTGYTQPENIVGRHNSLGIGSCDNRTSGCGPIGETTNSEFDDLHHIGDKTYNTSTNGLRATGINRTSEYTQLTADLSYAYPTTLNLSSWIRNVVWIRPGVFYILDYVSISSGSPNLSMWFNSMFNLTVDGSVYRFTYPANPTVGTFQILVPSSPTVTVANNTFSIKGQKPSESARGQHMNIDQTPSGGKAYYITVVDTNAIADTRTVTNSGGFYTITEGSHTIQMNQSNGTVTVDGSGGGGPSDGTVFAKHGITLGKGITVHP